MPGQDYPTTLDNAPKTFVDSTADEASRRKSFNNPKRAERRKIARDVSTVYFAMAKVGGLESAETRASFALSSLCYDIPGQDYDAAREISLARIGAALSSRSDDDEAKRDGKLKEAWEARARRNVGPLFNQAYPRVGRQFLTRYKSTGEGAHKYVDHALATAELFAELFDEDRKAILSSKADRKQKGVLIGEALERRAREAFEYLPKCEVEVIYLPKSEAEAEAQEAKPEVEAVGETYAYMSGPEAKAFCVKNPDFTVRPFQYVKPEPKPEQRRPYCGDDFKRLKRRAVDLAVDEILNAIGERNGKDTARAFWKKELLPALEHAGERWMNVYREREEEEETEELIHVTQNEGGGATEPGPETNLDPLTPPDKMSGEYADNFNESGNIDFSTFDTADSDASAESCDSGVVEPKIEPAAGAAEPAQKPLEGSENFDSSLDAALWYAGGGFPARFPVLPVCSFDASIGRCSWDKHPATCTGRKPLVKGDESGGYSAATYDLDKIQKWFTRQFRGQGVAIRLDGHIAIDADVKDNAGGLQSYQTLSDTFSLPETLSAITHSGGAHHVFELPEGLPQGWLKSWVRVGDKVGLPGIDIKVHVGGLLFVEPTCGPKGCYRWVNVDAGIAILPREACDFLHEARFKQTPEEKAKAEKAQGVRAAYASVNSLPASFSSDQSKFLRDVPDGERHRRLFEVGCSIRANTRASAYEIAEAMRQHDAGFSTPTRDERYIQRTARDIEKRY